MLAIFHKKFEKRYLKQPQKIQEKFLSQLSIFYNNQQDPRLSNHELQGKYKNHRSINVSGDIRAIYKKVNNLSDDVVFVDIGSHSELYS